MQNEMKVLHTVVYDYRLYIGAKRNQNHFCKVVCDFSRLVYSEQLELYLPNTNSCFFVFFFFGVNIEKNPIKMKNWKYLEYFSEFYLYDDI